MFFFPVFPFLDLCFYFFFFLLPLLSFPEEQSGSEHASERASERGDFRHRWQRCFGPKTNERTNERQNISYPSKSRIDKLYSSHSGSERTDF